LSYLVLIYRDIVITSCNPEVSIPCVSLVFCPFFSKVFLSFFAFLELIIAAGGGG